MEIENFSKIIFPVHESNNLYLPALGAPRHDCQQNMGAERPVFRILHPKPCAHNTYAILGYVLCAHGFAWKMRNIVSSAPRFRRQPSILSYNMEVYHALVCELTKIDVKPIFGSLDQCHILALILETPEIGEASIFPCTNTNAWHVSLLHITILEWLQNMVCKLWKLRSKHVFMCAC